MRGDGFATEQRRVLAGMAAAAIVTAIALAWGRGLVPVPPLPTSGDRIAFVLWADLFLALPPALTVATIARLRFFSRADIAGVAFSTASDAVAIGNAILANTLEQTLLALVVHLGLAAVLPPDELAIVPVLVALFLAGRLCFAIGYARGAGARSFGFALTFYPTLAALAWALWRGFV